MIYTLIESAKRHGHEPYAYLKNVLERLPSTTTTGLDVLLPVDWKPPEQNTALCRLRVEIPLSTGGASITYDANPSIKGAIKSLV